MESRRPKKPTDRNKVILIIQICIVTIIGAKLFYMQILRGSHYEAIAAKEHAGYTELPARRGEILIKDYHNNELFRIATNTTLDMVYADPTLVKNPQAIVETFTPLLFDAKEARTQDNQRLEEIAKKLDPLLPEEEKQKKLIPLTDEELQQQFKNDMSEQITTTTRPRIILATDIDAKIIEKINEKGLVGVEARDGMVAIYPPKITNLEYIAQALSGPLATAEEKIIKIISAKNRFVVLRKKLAPEISKQMREFLKKDKEKKFAGIGMQEEYYRYYPENTLAANLIGYVNNSGNGLYGVENSFNAKLKGKNGIFQTQKDSVGRQITVGQSVIQPAVDGDDIVLTIDRSIQMELDRILAEGTKNTRADSGQGIVMDPKTGRILAISHYPSFDPNDYGKVFEKEKIDLKPEEIQNLKPINEKTGEYYLILNAETGERINVFKETGPDGKNVYKKYKNMVGPEAYHNKIVSWEYEPGSVFKAIAMAAAVDDKDVTPDTLYNDIGPVKTDEYEIHNATEKYFGTITMRTVLEKSLNTGMSFVARKIGRNLFYNYIQRFGFGQKTDIELNDEVSGKVSPWTKWAESELITHSFGQGLTVTPLQMVNSYAAIANNGLLMQPYIVDEIREKNGRIIKNEPHSVHQVISPETAQIMKGMLMSAVENGVARHAQVAHHYVAGKTGTAQTYYKGKPLSGAGTTIGNIVGFAPMNDPQFVILIKLDKPRQSEWADLTAAPMFAKMADFLFDYYNIPPDKTTGINYGESLHE